VCRILHYTPRGRLPETSTTGTPRDAADARGINWGRCGVRTPVHLRYVRTERLGPGRPTRHVLAAYQDHAVRYTSPVELCAGRPEPPPQLTVRWTPGTCRGVTPEGAGRAEDMSLRVPTRLRRAAGVHPGIDASGEMVRTDLRAQSVRCPPLTIR
jgi:hypothetical protein